VVETLLANPLVHIQIERFGGRLYFGVGVDCGWRGCGCLFVGSMKNKCRGKEDRGRKAKHFHWHGNLRFGKWMCFLFHEIVGYGTGGNSNVWENIF
jgi:hypothetical protein